MRSASPYTLRRQWRRLVLEISLKPFRDPAPAALRATWREILGAWVRVIRRSDALGILFWVGDGSEILDFSGDLAQRLEWGRYVGFCNLDALPDLYYPGWYQNRPGRPFDPAAPELTYGDLKAIIEALRAVAAELGVGEVTAGATFDPGPEFAYSPFKYQRHPEILMDFGGADMLAPMRFVSHQSALHADPQPYGGFPAGIPEDTSFGEYLGRQYAALAAAVGFDYLWLSNGFAYSHYAWTPTGELVQRGEWRTDRAAEQTRRTLAFWRDFRRVCPDAALEVRGSNFPLGVDLASDGASHRAITEVGRLMVSPPNLPVLHADLLSHDVICYLTRIAETPGLRIPYRHYLNDPWFEQNPWYDIYNREPLEVYTAMSCSRLNDGGGVEVPTDLHVLSIDTERGDVPPEEVDDITPHLLRALDERADAAGPLVWVYPYDEFHDVLEQRPELLPHVWFLDQYLVTAVDGGLPLLTVCSSRRFVHLQRAGLLPPAIYLAPAPLGEWAYADALLDHVAGGGQAMLYGSLAEAPARLREALGVTLTDEGLEGDLAVTQHLRLDDFEVAPDSALPLKHRANACGGGIRECATPGGPTVLTAVRQGAATRAYAVRHGGLAWIRGTVPFALPTAPPLFRLAQDQPGDAQRPQEWPRRLLAELGLDLLQHRRAADVKPAQLFLKRHRGAFYLVGAKPDTTVHARLRCPDGAPAFTEYDTPVVEGYAVEHFGKTVYNEIRCFVRCDDGVVKVKALPFGPQHERCYAISGLVDATVTFYPDPRAAAEGRVLVQPEQWSDTLDDAPTVPFRYDPRRGCLVIDRHTGPLVVKW